MGAKPTPPQLPPQPSINELNAYAIGRRNRGEFWVGRLDRGPILIDDWLKREFERYGYDLKDMAQL